MRLTSAAKLPFILRPKKGTRGWWKGFFGKRRCADKKKRKYVQYTVVYYWKESFDVEAGTVVVNPLYYQEDDNDV